MATTNVFSRVALATMVVCGIGGIAQAAPGRPLPADACYPYNGPVFQQFVRESYELAPNHGRGIMPFTTYFDQRARKFGAPQGIEAYLKAQKASIASARTEAERTRRQLVLAQSLHRLVKKTITKFSLDRGFEFANVVRTGERQCLLQSVLVASMLQKAGVDAGSVMVWRGESGEASNLGHVVTLMHAANGRDVLVDCSEMHPFPKQQGLFLPEARTGQYRFVTPQYTSAPPAPHVLPKAPPTVAGTPFITGYTTVSDNRVLPVAQMRPLSVAYLKSQFDYYRGERVPGGILTSHPDPAALRQAASFWERSIKRCPQNPLSTYQLGRVQAKIGQSGPSTQHLQAAYRLYKGAGYIPRTAVEMVALDQPVRQARQGQPIQRGTGG